MGDYKASAEEIAIVHNAIGIGRENATTRHDLCRMTGLDDRVVRDAIQRIRKDYAVFIGATGKGYYIPRVTREERKTAERWILSQERRAASIKESERGAKIFMKKCDQQVEGQLSLFGGCDE